MRDVISIEKQTETEDEYGSKRNEWLPFDVIRGKVEYIRGSEFYGAGQILNDRVITVETWNRSDITPDMRIKFNGGTFDIKSVIPDKRYRRKMMIEAVDNG